MKDLKLFLLQGQNNNRTKSPQHEGRTSTPRVVQFVTCHSCGLKGHYKNDCSNQEKFTALTSNVKLAKVHLVQIANSATSAQEELEVMMAKQGRPTKEIPHVATERH